MDNLRANLATGSPRDAIRKTLIQIACASAHKMGRRGCLVVASAIELAAHDVEVGRRVNAALARNEAVFESLIRASQAEGQIPASVDAARTARLIVCLTQGMRVVGRAGRRPPEDAFVVAQVLQWLR